MSVGVSARYGTPRCRNYTMAQDKHLGGKTKERTPSLHPVSLSKFLPCSSFHHHQVPCVLLQIPIPSLPCNKWRPWATASPNTARQGRSNSTCPKREKPESPTESWVYSTPWQGTYKLYNILRIYHLTKEQFNIICYPFMLKTILCWISSQMTLTSRTKTKPSTGGNSGFWPDE